MEYQLYTYPLRIYLLPCVGILWPQNGECIPDSKLQWTTENSNKSMCTCDSMNYLEPQWCMDHFPENRHGKIWQGIQMPHIARDSRATNPAKNRGSLSHALIACRETGILNSHEAMVPRAIVRSRRTPGSLTPRWPWHGEGAILATAGMFEVILIHIENGAACRNGYRHDRDGIPNIEKTCRLVKEMWSGRDLHEIFNMFW